MSILERLEDTGRFGRDAVKQSYGDKIVSQKINRQQYQKCIEMAHVHSKVAICEALLRSHKEEPYRSADELIGDLQLILVDSWNHFRKLNYTPTKFSVEDLIGDGLDKLRIEVRR